MDPLSIAAAVAGIVSGAINASTTLGNIIQKSHNAPKECKDVKREVDNIGQVLTQLQVFVLGASKASRSRTSLILVEQVVTTLSACVLTFSELDVFVQGLDSEQKMGILDRMKWIIKSNALKELLERLQQHKISLNLMLTILTWYVNCTSMPLLVPGRFSPWSSRAITQAEDNNSQADANSPSVIVKVTSRQRTASTASATLSQKF